MLQCFCFPVDSRSPLVRVLTITQLSHAGSYQHFTYLSNGILIADKLANEYPSSKSHFNKLLPFPDIIFY